MLNLSLSHESQELDTVIIEQIALINGLDKHPTNPIPSSLSWNGEMDQSSVPGTIIRATIYSLKTIWLSTRFLPQHPIKDFVALKDSVYIKFLLHV